MFQIFLLFKISFNQDLYVKLSIVAYCNNEENIQPLSPLTVVYNNIYIEVM